MNAQNSATVTIDRKFAIQTLKVLGRDVSSLDIENFRKEEGLIRKVAKIKTEGNRAFARYLTAILKFSDSIGLSEKELLKLLLEGKKRY